MTTAQPSGNAPESNAAPKSQRIGVPKEIFPGEKRVATVPDVVTKLIKLGFAVVVEQGAGDLADLPDSAYEQAGASIAPSAAVARCEAHLARHLRHRSASDRDAGGQLPSCRGHWRPPGRSSGHPGGGKPDPGFVQRRALQVGALLGSAM